MKSWGHGFSPWFTHIKEAICKLPTVLFYFPFFKHSLPHFQVFFSLTRVEMFYLVFLLCNKKSVSIYVCIFMLFPSALGIFSSVSPLSPLIFPIWFPSPFIFYSLFLPFILLPHISFCSLISLPCLIFWPSVCKARWVCWGSEHFWEPLWLFSVLCVCVCLWVCVWPRLAAVVGSSLPFQWMWV